MAAGKISAMVANNQRGFTLIELIMVIVILGILAVVAVPKYQDIRTEAAKAQANGVYGAAQSATAINFAAGLVGKDVSRITTGDKLLDAMDGAPDGWTADGTTISGNVNDTTYTITVTTAETTTTKAALSKSWSDDE